MAQRTEVNQEEHAKRQKAAAEQTEKALEAENLPETSTHPMVDTQLTTREHLGKIPGEPDKKQDISGVNLEIIPPPVATPQTVKDNGKEAEAAAEQLRQKREAQEEGVESAIEAAKERTAETEEMEKASREGKLATSQEDADKANRHAKATGQKQPIQAKKQVGKKH
jgi:hypothetical protein